MGHLPSDATLAEYNALVAGLLSGLESMVYRYPFGARDYYGVSAKVGNVDWLVIFGSTAILETAFPPRDLTDYLTRHGFVPMGRVEECVRE